MKKTALAIVACGLLWSGSAQAESNHKADDISHQKYEYQTFTTNNVPTAEQLNAWGEKGWRVQELTFVQGVPMYFVLILMREKR